MSELNFELLQKNIRELLEKHGLTQNALADIAGMAQSNVSKALNPKETKQFTIDQLFRIAQHFGVSIDELVGNKAPQEAAISPRTVLSFFITLLSEGHLKSQFIDTKEFVFEPFYGPDGYPDCLQGMQPVTYPAFYLENYLNPYDFSENEHEYDEIVAEFCYGGNESRFKEVNVILEKLLPVIDLYRKKQHPDEAFRMIIDGYLEKLPEK